MKVSVLIVTYKQENLIGRTIESVLKQKDYGLYEIVICDDCSPDGNWDVIQKYANQYPDIIRAYRNEKNLGIYGNSNKLVTLRGDADFFCWLEGDDELCDDFLKEMQNYLSHINLIPNETVAILSNFIIKSPNGSTIIDKRNEIVNRKKYIFGLYMRGLLSWRASLFSSGVLNLFVPAILDRGLSLAESSFDCQFFKNTKKAYYNPIVGAIYNAGIGVSVNLNDVKSEYRTSEAIEQWEHVLEFYSENAQDKYYCKANINRAAFLLRPSLPKAIKAILFYVTGMMINYPVSIKRIKSFIGPMARVVIDKYNS